MRFTGLLQFWYVVCIVPSQAKRGRLSAKMSVDSNWDSEHKVLMMYPVDG